MSRTRPVAAIAICITLLAACHRSASSTRMSKAALAALVTVTDCPPAAPRARGEPPARGTLSLVLRPDPPADSTTQASVRLEGEVTRNAMQMSVGDASQFTLDAGLYVVRVAMKGYTALEGRVRLTPGCEATMTFAPKQVARE